MGSIFREIYILSSRRVAPIDIVYGSEVPILFKMMDVAVPVGAEIVFYAQQEDGTVYPADGWEAENIAGFTPSEGFFALGGNLLQVEINGKLIPIAVEVRCHKRLSGAGSTEKPEQVRPLVQQAQDAAQEARERAESALESQEVAAGSASAAAGSAGAAAGSAEAAAGSAREAGDAAASAGQSANAAAGSAQAALESQEAAAGSASAAAGSAGAAAGSADAAAGSAQEAGDSANAADQSASAAAGSAQAAMESQNSAAGSASAAAGSAGAAAGSADAAAGSAQEAGDAANAADQSASAAAGSAKAAEESARIAAEEAAKSNIKSVCGVAPDERGNISLSAENVGARPDTWTPTAEDVGARPDTWTPTAEDVGARPDTWTPTAEDVGARPDTWMPTADDVGAVPSSGILSKTYPVGAIYLSADSTSPAALFGGTWEQITDRFLLGAGGSYSAGDTGGEAEHTLIIDEMPSHTHTVETLFSKGTSGADRQTFSPTRNWWTETTNAAFAKAAGGGMAHNNMPPYLAVYMWKRVA